MVDPRVLARCNLFGVMKNLEYLAEHDEPSKTIAEGKDISIQFLVKNGPRAVLEIKSGRIELREGKGRSSVLLYFTSPQHFNAMVAGEGNPIPLRGLTKLGYLKGPFTLLTDRLEYYLRPDPKDLENSGFFKMNTEMTAYAAFFSLAEIANHDRRGKQCASHLPDGVVQVSVEGGLGIWLEAKGGELTARKGTHENPRAVLAFSDVETAHNILNGKEDTYTNMALGKMKMRGYIPLIEYLDPILDMVAEYLS